jgi:hypothetical protein
MGRGWFPSAPKKKDRSTSTREINVITKKDDLEEGEIEEEVESDPEEDNTDEEESREESTDDEDYEHLCNDREGIKTFHAYVPSCFTKMFNVIMKHGEEAFLSING